MATQKLYTFGVYNNTRRDAFARVECAFLSPENLERDKRLISELRKQPGLMRSLICMGVQLKEPDGAMIQMLADEISVDDGRDWRAQLGRKPADENAKVEREWSSQKPWSDSEISRPFAISHHSFKRLRAMVKIEDDRHFSILSVKHYAGDQKKQERLVGGLTFLFLPNRDPFRK